MTDQAGKHRILVVDDRPENVDILANLLCEEYQVLVALDGVKAMDIAGKEPPPDLILLDVMMPNMDGYEVCRRLKKEKSTQDIPVIFVTAMGEVEDEARGFELGAVDFLTKPINPQIVKARVHTHLALKEARDKIENFSEQISRYVSPQIKQSIFEGKQDASIGASRKKLTVFFSDIVQFTYQTEHMEPEDLTSLLNSYLDRMAEIALKHGGTVDKFIGDAVMVFFGDPDSKGVQQDAVSCVKMALDMQLAIEDLKVDWKDKGIVSEFDVRMGITTGYCTVGNFGCETRMDYTIIGNQVNLASRLETSAAAGTILIAKETHALVRDEFICEEKDPIDAKGFDRPIATYQVIGPVESFEQGRIYKKEKKGFSLSLDLDAIDESERQEIIEYLRIAGSSLK